MATQTPIRNSQSRLVLTLVLLFIATLGAGCPKKDSGSSEPPTEANLSIAPIAQQTEVWCWAASAQMVFDYYDLPNVNPGGNYQCGVVGTYRYLRFGPFDPCVSNCGLCVAPIANTTEMQILIAGYGATARTFGFRSDDLRSKAKFGSLSFDSLAENLDRGRPVLAGINFRPGFSLPGISQHMVVITGYDALGELDLVTVNDPYPYQPGMANPWLFAGARFIRPGQYEIQYLDLVDRLRWDNTISSIR